MLVLAATTPVVHEGRERNDKDLVGAAFCAQTLDKARRALREWLNL